MKGKKEMNISKIKIIWKFVTGGREAVLDYILGIANDFAARLDDQKKSDVAAYLGVAENILGALEGLAWLVPSKWHTAYADTITAFNAVVLALGDLKVTPDEVANVTADFRTAYQAWMLPDEVTATAK